ncbi:RING finger domain-containing protein [Apiospora rasikravindrae]|uniref:RING finger domain-containing protein n=1 Tax=Apiospora rasikravindrae TaxID=990691 RepID=A0ABR1UBY8_9PEZI
MQPPLMEPQEPRDDDAPPPPYSETDIYSNASARSPIAPRSGSNVHADDVSIAASSSHSNIIYTPPETPRESHYNFSGGGDLTTSTSAQAYFESRPVASPSAGLELVHVVAYQENATPADFPYPSWAASHQTTEQDWHTFVNYLIPDYALSVNAQLVDRKLHADDQVRSTSETGREIEEAQVNQIMSSADGASRRRGFDETLSTVIEWNEGFFGPRGVAIRLDPPPNSPRIPGGWNTSFDSVNAANPPPQDRSPQQQQGSPGGLGSFFEPSRFNMEANSNGLRFGPISINGDRVSIGRSFHADSNGVRWGEQAVDQSRAPPFGTRGGRGDDTDGFNHGHRQDDGFGRGRGRGRGHYHGGRRGRSSSSSSASSDDSSSSSDSDSSLGSLPDWDDLKDSQIPVVKQSVSLWVQNSGHPVSKAEFKRVKAEIKAAKSASAKGPADAAQKDEVKRLLAQWKDVKKSQKATRKLAKKEKKAQKKNQKKERKARRNAERGEHRRGRRERRRSERECRRGEPHPAAETPGAGFGIPGISGVVPGFPRPPPAGPSHHGGPPHRGLHHQGHPHHGPPHHVPPPHQGPRPFGFGPGRAGGPGFLGGMGLFGGPLGRCGSGGRGSWDPIPCDDLNMPYGDEKAKEAREEAEAASKAAAERAQEAQERASLERQAALERAQQARDQAEASRQSALASAQEARDRAQVSRDAGLRNAQASRDAALASAQQARDRAQLSRDVALTNAHASRDAALANAQASRERGLNQTREAARGYGGWSSFGRAFDARQNAREWVRTARETAMRHAWSTTSGAQAHADAAREHARHTAAAAAGGAERGVPPVPPADDDNAFGGDGLQETGIVNDNRNSRSVKKKYEAIVSLESELEAKMSNLYRLEQTIQTEGVAAAQAGNGDSKTQSPAQQEYERLGTDIDEMSRRIEALRLEADEEFARELAEDEAAATRP